MRSLIFVFVLAITSVHAQITQLSGTVYHKKYNSSVKKPVSAGAFVYIPQLANAVTDDNGLFVLNLKNCTYCTPGSKLLLQVNSSYGWAEQEITLSNEANQNFKLEIIENNQLLLNGLIRDRKNNNPIAGLRVSAVTQGAPKTPSVATDETGFFQIVLNQEGISNQQAITLSVMDSKQKYKPVEKTVFINSYEPITIEMERATTEPDPVDNARRLAVGEIVSNIQNLDSRLLFMVETLELNKQDAFTLRFDSIFKNYAPGIDSDPGGNLNKLTMRTNIGSLRQALNSVPMKQDFGPALVQVFIQADLKEESQVVNLYLQQFSEVQWAETTLFEALDAYANSKDTSCRAQADRIALGWKTVCNRAALLQVYALRLMEALHTDTEVWKIPFSTIKVLPRLQPLTQAQADGRLLILTGEMSALMQKRAAVLNELTKCRDRELEKGREYIERNTTIYPEDTWQEVIIKARLLRSLDRREDAVKAFEYYGSAFSATDSTARAYSETAVRFTREIDRLNVGGGVYLYAFTEKSHIRTAGLKPGDILVRLQNKPVAGMDDVQKIFLDTLSDQPVELQILRWNDKAGRFNSLRFTIPSKPMGGMFLPI